MRIKNKTEGSWEKMRPDHANRCAVSSTKLPLCCVVNFKKKKKKNF